MPSSRGRGWPRLLAALAIAPLVLGTTIYAETVNWAGPQTLNAPGGDDDLSVLADAFVTLGGAGSVVSENLLSNDSSSLLTTLTIDNADASLRTLAVGATTLANSGGQSLIIAGSANFRPGLLSDNGSANVQLVKSGGSGELILDNPASSLFGQGTLLRVVSGTLSIEGGGGSLSPVSSLSSALQIDGALGKLRLGTPSAAGTIFGNNIAVNASGTLEHSASSNDTLDGSVTIATGKTLNANITAGSLAVAGTLFGSGMAKNGAGELRFTNSSTLDVLEVHGGRLEFSGNVALTTAPLIGVGATLALTASAGNTLPALLSVPTGTLEIVAGSLGATLVNLTGGTLKISGNSAVNLGAAISGSGAVTHSGPGVLNLDSVQAYQTLNADNGVTNVNSSFTGGTATINAHATTNFAASQTIAALNIGGSAVAAFAGPGEVVAAAVVPEPASWGLLLGAAGLLLGRRRRA